jgi:hypothetical protein
MKKIYIFLVMFVCTLNFCSGQVLLAKWTFPTGTEADSIPDAGIPANLVKAIHTGGGTSAIDFSKNGYTTKSAQATGWDNGNGTKFWIIEISATGYENIAISSRQQSGGANPGPKDFKLQYRVGTAGTWTDVPDATITVANDWTTSYVDSISLPVECNDQASLLIRWLMTSNDDSAGGIVASTGISKIDDIYVYGIDITGISRLVNSVSIDIYPNPADNYFFISDKDIKGTDIINITGQVVVRYSRHNTEGFDISSLLPGLYIVKMYRANDLIPVEKKLIIR